MIKNVFLRDSIRKIFTEIVSKSAANVSFFDLLIDYDIVCDRINKGHRESWAIEVWDNGSTTCHVNKGGWPDATLKSMGYQFIIEFDGKKVELRDIRGVNCERS